ncbi:MAG TPA: glycoside hydrolase family 25 protein [Pyrinomonadaceae bacterium]|jgi:lysozyme|nr:glycoside hydrolase family 25 protein [Pyrinomonadaceae bacterium]
MAINVVVDLSHHNASVDFKAAQANGIVGVIHKATEGVGYTDNMYAGRRSEALAAGLMWGAYHFGSADDGVAQAKYFLSVVNPGPNDLMVLDFEQNYNSKGQPTSSMTLQQAEDFLTYVQSQTGRWPGFYSGSYIKQLLGSNRNSTLVNCWFWLAQYGPTPQVPATWTTWTMWQYTDGTNGPQPHSVNGIGNCDRDQFNGSLDGLRRLWGFTS